MNLSTVYRKPTVKSGLSWTGIGNLYMVYMCMVSVYMVSMYMAYMCIMIICMVSMYMAYMRMVSIYMVVMYRDWRRKHVLV